MVKIRLKRLGYKKNPTYRIVVITSSTKREGAPIQELGFYNPKTKEMKLNKDAALEWIKKGAQPSETVQYLINNCDKEGKLVYKVKDEVKLSKKAKAKIETAKADAEAAKVKAAEEKKAAAEEAKAAKAEPKAVVEEIAAEEAAEAKIETAAGAAEAVAEVKAAAPAAEAAAEEAAEAVVAETEVKDTGVAAEE